MACRKTPEKEQKNYENKRKYSPREKTGGQGVPEIRTILKLGTGERKNRKKGLVKVRKTFTRMPGLCT